MSRTLIFFVGGIGSILWVTCGFIGTYSSELRYAFTIKLAALLFICPALLALGRPISLARIALGPSGRRRLRRVLQSRATRVVGNAIFAPLFGAVVFLALLTPLAGLARVSTVGEAVVTIAAPLAGFAIAAPLLERFGRQSSAFLGVEVLLAFVELLLDAIPAIVLRLQGRVVDGVTRVGEVLPWFPNPLRDQQLAGDALWFLAEFADLPVIIFLVLRWMRRDRRDARAMDELTDEQVEQLTREHLARFGARRGVEDE